jgi:D-amino-acid dehydrogenase
LTPSHAPPLATWANLRHALQWMLRPDAPLYLPPRWDPALWRWLLGVAGQARAAHFRHALHARAALLLDSRQRLARWVGHYDLACGHADTGLDYVYRDPRAFAQGRRDTAPLADLGIPVEAVAGADYMRLEPALRPGVAGAIRFAGDGQLRPERLLDALAHRIRAGGGGIVEHCVVQDIAEDADGLRLVTSTGSLRAREVVLAAGAWSPRLAARLGVRVPVQPGKGYSMTYTRPSRVPSRAIVLKERAVCVTAWDDGFRLGSTMEFSGYDERLDERRLAALERAAREYLHEPVGATRLERWCGWRPMSVDDLPLIGRAPGWHRLWLATGHGMMGVSMSAASAQLIADLMTGSVPALDPSPYDPVRFA